MRQTFWIWYPRGFSNEYCVGVALSGASADRYLAEGYARVSRKAALRMLSDRGDATTEIRASATVDGVDADRFEVARNVRGRHDHR
jgi:hypothetical protein